MGKTIATIKADETVSIAAENTVSMQAGFIGDEETCLQIAGFVGKTPAIVEVYYPQVITNNGEKTIVRNAITELTVMVTRLQAILNNTTV